MEKVKKKMKVMFPCLIGARISKDNDDIDTGTLIIQLWERELRKGLSLRFSILSSYLTAIINTQNPTFALLLFDRIKLRQLMKDIRESMLSAVFENTSCREIPEILLSNTYW